MNNYVQFKKLLEVLINITSNYKIISISESNNFILHSHELYSMHSNEIKFKILNKLFSNNFKKIFIKLYFKNVEYKKNSRPANNVAYLKLELNNNNRLYVEDLNMLMCFEDLYSINLLENFFKNSNSKLSINIIDNDIRLINKINFRQPVKIKNITNCDIMYNDFPQMFYSDVEHIDIENTIYDQDLLLKIKFKISIFNVYFILEFSEFYYNDYHKFINLISEKIRKNNQLIHKEFKEEKKILSNDNLIFLKLKFSIIDIDNVIELLNKIKEINNNNNSNIDKNYNYYKLLSHIIQDSDKLEEISKFIEYNQDNIFLVKTKSNSERDYKRYLYLCFRFKTFEIYIGIDEEKYLDFEMFKKMNVINSLLEKLFTNNIIDEIEKCSLY